MAGSPRPQVLVRAELDRSVECESCFLFLCCQKATWCTPIKSPSLDPPAIHLESEPFGRSFMGFLSCYLIFPLLGEKHFFFN